jgi:hypothetical protein
MQHQQAVAAAAVALRQQLLTAGGPAAAPFLLGAHFCLVRMQPSTPTVLRQQGPLQRMCELLYLRCLLLALHLKCQDPLLKPTAPQLQRSDLLL